MRLAYGAAGLSPPASIVWCDSPRAMTQAMAQSARGGSSADGRNVKFALVDRVHRQVAARVGRRVHRNLVAAVESAGAAEDALVAGAAELVMRGLADRRASLIDDIRRHGLSLSEALMALVIPERVRSGAVGLHALSWLAAYDFLRDVFALEAETRALRGLTLLAANVGWLDPYERACWLAERPKLLCGDARDRLHHASGPALRFADGWSFWAWRGVEVPRWIIEQKDDITLAAIDREVDIQVRRCMIEIMTPQRYVALGGATRVAEDETGILWRRNWLAADAWAAVEVVNATPEPDGTRRHFFLQVPANLRTAREAVAWTYGMRAEAYAQLVLRT
ncbi:hypothetical protein JQ543_17610 [Bradyrhizobium diazoefficiens]|nr:hypothetical protein [Bradyrhizobium diazoefficiens]MBR0849574.1 hypothetical protein [Bradyrhizobium diazoefficiens]